MKRSDFLKITGLSAFSSSFALSEFSGEDKPTKPDRLREGDIVGLAAPAGIVYEESEFKKMKEVLESFGLEVRFGEFVRDTFGYFSGTDFHRALDLNRFFIDPAIKGIVAVRGGWGCARILKHLDFEAIRKNPKIYCGFSDNTTLHLAFLKYSGLVSFHGPNGTSDWTELTRKSFKSVLMDGKAAVYTPSDDVRTIIPGTAEGKLVGGNLAILETSLGTPYQPDVKGAILFTEDVGEPAYKIDRMMTHLKHAGVLDQISGFVFGQCTNCSESSSRNSFSIRQVLDHHIIPLGIPAVTGVDIGHVSDNITIPLGVRAKLDAATGVIQLSEPAVIL